MIEAGMAYQELGRMEKLDDAAFDPAKAALLVAQATRPTLKLEPYYRHIQKLKDETLDYIGNQPSKASINLRIEALIQVTVRRYGYGGSEEVEIDPEFYSRALAGLLGVTTDEDGTGYDAFNTRNYDGVFFPLEESPVAGKTGTAEVRGKADTAVFAAFGPVDEPRFAISVFLEEAGFGSRSAAPFVARVMEKLVTDTVEKAPTAAVSYARSAALPLCLEWLEWLDTDQLSNVGGSNSAVGTDTGPVLEANGEVRVRGEVIDCASLLADNGITVSIQ